MDYDDYSNNWIKEHPYQKFFLGLKTTLDYKRFYVPYENNQKEGGMLAITPNKSGTQIISMGIYVIVILLLIRYSVDLKFSFENLIIMSIFVLCLHFVYMYYFTRLAVLNHKEYSKQHILSEFLCIIGLFIPLQILTYNVQNYENYKQFISKYELSKYSDKATRIIYMEMKNNDLKTSIQKINEEVEILRKKFILN